MVLPLPGADLQVIENGLGLVASPASTIVAHLGCCSLGPTSTDANSPNYISKPVAFGNLADVMPARGIGPLVHAAAYPMDKLGASVVLVRLPKTKRNASTSALEEVPDNESLNPVVTGTPLDRYSFVFKFVSAAIAATAGFTESAATFGTVENAQQLDVEFEVGGVQSFPITLASAVAESLLEPFMLTDGQTIIIDGHTRAISSGEFVDINAATADEVVAIYQDLILQHSLLLQVTNNGGMVRVESLKKGSGITFVVGEGTINGQLGGTLGTGDTYTGSGDFADNTAPTQGELLTLLTGLTDGAASIVGGRVRLTSATLGSTSTAQVKNTTTATAFGFTFAIHTGADGVAGTIGSDGITYRWSKNGGVDWSDVLALGLATSVVLGDTGQTISFTPGDAPNAGDQILWTTAPASESIGEFSAVLDVATTSVLTPSGTPEDAYNVVVEALTSWTIGSAGGQVRYSLDGGRKWTPALNMGTSDTLQINAYTLQGVAYDTGIDVTWSAGDVTAGDRWSFPTFGPEAQDADIIAGIEALRKSALGWSFIHVVGQSNAATVALVNGKLEAITANAVYTWAALSGRDRGTYEPDADWRSFLVANVDGVAASRSAMVGGQRRLLDPITGAYWRRPFMWVVVARTIQFDIEVDPARVQSGPLWSDVEIHDADGTITEHDAALNADLHGARYITARTYKEVGGLYITRGNMLAAEGTDITRIPLRRVLDLGSLIFRRVMILQLENNVFVNPATFPDVALRGCIREDDANTIEREIEAGLLNELAGKISGVTVKVRRTDNLLTNGGKVRADVRFTPLAYIDNFEGTIAYQNPALVIQEA